MVFALLLSLLVPPLRALARRLRLEVPLEYALFVAQWLAWVLDWPLRALEMSLDACGVRPAKRLALTVRILTDAHGTPALAEGVVRERLQRAEALLAGCGVRLDVAALELLEQPAALEPLECRPRGMLRRFFTWFAARSAGCGTALTVYFARDIRGVSGCAYPGSDWLLLDRGGDGTVLVHEILHLADVWPHSRDQDNVMASGWRGSHDRISAVQRLLLRSARFVRRA